MCMFVKAGKDELMTAEKDIVCYKVMYAMGPIQSVDMRKYPDYNPLYAMSLYYSEIYKWGEEYTEAAMPTESTLKVSQYPAHVTIGFHSYRRLKDAESACHSSMIIVKCIIPRGSYYWTGNRGGWGQEKYDEYCSDHIELVAWLDPESGEWRRPKYRVNDWPESSKVSILIGLDIKDAARMLSRWYVCESSHLNYNCGTYLFYRAGHGYVELHTYCNKVTGVV